jgi:biopolymer transport protein ExbD
MDSKIQSCGDTISNAAKPIVIVIGVDETISVGDDAALGALKHRLAQIAAMDPQATIAIQAPHDASYDRVRAVIDLCRAARIKRISFGTR